MLKGIMTHLQGSQQTSEPSEEEQPGRRCRLPSEDGDFEVKEANVSSRRFRIDSIQLHKQTGGQNTIAFDPPTYLKTNNNINKVKDGADKKENEVEEATILRRVRMDSLLLHNNFTSNTVIESSDLP
ncbi:hypothetical protein ScalyP_jg4036 [Parmales sp. scaly parma]|nr:hypothetical protein ScalyP_jg4036 [Parmales sp. scaly parma]